jgi:hypothetical protein
LFLPFLVVTIVFISKNRYIGYWYKCLVNVGVEEPIVNAPLVSLKSKNTNNALNASKAVSFLVEGGNDTFRSSESR